MIAWGFDFVPASTRTGTMFSKAPSGPQRQLGEDMQRAKRSPVGFWPKTG